MDYNKTAIFSDLDGTLFNKQGKISPENKAAVERYIAAGGLFALSTGRAPCNAMYIAAELATNAPSIMFNGASLFNFSAGEGRLIAAVDMAAAEEFMRRCLAFLPNCDLQIYTESEIFYLTPLETADQPFLAIHQPCRYISMEEALEHKWVKCLVLGPVSEVDRCQEMAKEYEGRLDYVRAACDITPDEYIELLPCGSNKGSALAKLRHDPLFEGRTIIAAGDYRNDREILEEADVSVAPVSGLEEIKLLCDHIGPDNDDHLIKYIIDELIPSL